MPMFKKIRAEFQRLKKQGHNSYVRKDKIRMTMFDKEGAEFQSKEGKDQTSNIYRTTGTISM